MLETPQERIELLKAGFTTKEIENVYIKLNNYKVIKYPVIVELIEIE
ncbi:MAG: hypothetical protein OIN87_07595 [Candidatus Methanoperedens sp.]|nr:hypothetical protein [Candidatus Methanoperedens sp.]